MPEQTLKEMAIVDRASERMPSEASVRTIVPIVAGAAVLGLLVAGTVGLWMHYGTAVFFETIRAGFVACFG